MHERTLRGALPALLCTLLVAAACDDGSPTMSDMPVVMSDVGALEFGSIDNNFGPGSTFNATLTNTGTTSAQLGAITIEGTNASDFVITGGDDATQLDGGASVVVSIVFDPSASGSRQATLMAPVTNSDADAVMVQLSGMGGAYSYAQVDRIGIPTLNTVFNHPPQFSKTDYNVASPMADLADYTGLFETVLGAVGNADPSATAALLLPDALPVDMSASTTTFATLTGRDLADDAVDVALTVTVGPVDLHSDNVDMNDVAFLAAFPYLAAPNN